MFFNETSFFEFDNHSNILLNSTIDNFIIELNDGILSAQLLFALPLRKEFKSLKLNISDLVQININQTNEAIGQQIHNYKFLLDSDGYYLSFDPDESSLEKSDSDQDVFIFKTLNAEVN